MNAKKGDWVEIENVILKPVERTGNLPEETKKTPLVMWCRGFLESEKAVIGESVEILTLSGRKLTGNLIKTNPRHEYDYGDTVIELLQVGEELKRELCKIMDEGGF